MARHKGNDELQNPETWDWEQAERRPGAAARAVVSVAFSGEDFEHVSQAAERAGLKTSQFIRTAAVEKARGTSGHVSILLTTGSGGFSPFILSVRPMPMVEDHGWRIQVEAIKREPVTR